MMTWLLKIFIWLFSFFGFVLLVHIITPKIKYQLIPIIVISFFSVSITLMSLIGVGHIFIYILYISGIVLHITALVLILMKKKCMTISDYMAKDIFILLIAFIALGIALYGHRFEWWDSYSHWGIMVRRMLTYNALPDASDRSIQYVSYPPGMSCVLYYFCSFVDGSDHSMASCQLFITLASIYPIFAFVYKKGIGYKISLCCLSAVLLVSDYALTDIMVDEQLATVAAAGIMLIMLHKDDEELPKYSAYLCLIMAFETMIKSSGIYFSLLIFVYYLINVSHNLKSKMLLLGSIIIPWLLWTVHVKIAFPDAGSSNHAVSLSRYADIFDTRGAEQLQQLMVEYGKALSGRYMVYLFIVLAIILVFLNGKFATANSDENNTHNDKDDSDKLFRRDIIFLVISYVIWMVFVLAMYVFSLEDGDILELPSVGRYLATTEIFLEILILARLYGDGYLDFMKDVFGTGSKSVAKQKIAVEKVIAILICIYIFISWVIPMILNFNIYEKGNIVTAEYRDLCYSIKDEYNVPEGKRYLVYMGYDYDPYDPSEDARLKNGRIYLFQYIFNTDDFLFVDEDSFNSLDKNEYDYLIIMNDTSYPDIIFMEHISEEYAVPKGTHVIKLQ